MQSEPGSVWLGRHAGKPDISLRNTYDLWAIVSYHQGKHLVFNTRGSMSPLV
jgi:hypothetical protein